MKQPWVNAERCDEEHSAPTGLAGLWGSELYKHQGPKDPPIYKHQFEKTR